LIISAGFSLALLPGCSSGSCVEIGCRDQLVISIDPSIVVADGIYELTLESASESAVSGSCTLTIAGGESSANCSGTNGEFIEGGSPSFVFNFPPSTIDSQSLVTVKLSSAGTDLAAVEEIPAYDSQRPNGEDCPPVCLQGNIEIQ